jgi:hypothetical protein
MKGFVIWLFVFLVFCSFTSSARVNLRQYGLENPTDTFLFNQDLDRLVDSAVYANSIVASAKITSDIELPHVLELRTADFYMLLMLCLMLGAIRFIDKRYFYNLWVSFWNPTLSNGQLKDQLQRAGLPNILMNIFFAITVGSYIYYIVRFYTPHNTGVIPQSLLITMLILGTGVIYLVKYSAIRFLGWAFRAEAVTGNYLFNVFLLNKVLSIILLPFIIILAFANHAVVQQVLIYSFIVMGAMMLNRYMRSSKIFSSFFQYSTFHFFLYLCASELLPLAVLMKLLVKGLMFF